MPYYWDDQQKISLPVPAGGVPGGGGGLFGGLLGGGGQQYGGLLGGVSGGADTDQLMQALVRRQLQQALQPDWGRMAAAWAEAAMPSRLPVPMGAVLGKVAGAMGGGDEGLTKVLQMQKLLQDMQLTKRKSSYIDTILQGGGPGKAVADILSEPVGGAPGAAPVPGAPRPTARPRPPLSDVTSGDLSPTYGEPPTGDAGGIDPDLLGAPAAPPAVRPLAHLNYGGTGALGDPRAPGWAQANLTTVSAPGGAQFRVHQQAAPDIKGFLAELEEKGYPINPQTSGGHALRNIRGGNTLSEHAYGTAVDLNWDKNAYTKDGRLITNLPKDVAQIAAKYNLEWGGNWKSPVDAMHFQWRPGGTAPPQDTVMAAPRVPGVTQAAYQPAKDRFLDLAEPLESGGENVPNYKYGPRNTAGGFFQIDDPTWRDFAPPEVQAQYPNAMSAPREVQRAVAQRIPVNRWTDNNPKLAAAAREGGLLQTLSAIDPRQSPTAAVAGGLPPPDEVIRSGPPPAIPGLMRAQYSTVPGVDPSQSPAAAMGGGARTPPPEPAGPPPMAPGAAPPPMPAIPLPPNMDPRKIQALMIDLAQKSAAAEALGLPNIYGPMISVLQNSPQYKAMVEHATEGAKLTFEGPKAAARSAAEQPYLLERDAYKAHLDATNKQIEQLGAAALDPTTITVSDGQGGQTKIGATRAQAARAYAGLAVPELGIPARVTPAGGNGRQPAGTPTGEPIYGPTEQAMGTQLGKEIPERRSKAQDSAQSIIGMHEARLLLDKDGGIYSGTFGPAQLAWAKAKGWATGNPSEMVSNTEAFLAQRARDVAVEIKNFGAGTGLSDEDRKFAAKIAGGDQTLDEKSMRKIFDIGERHHRRFIENYNKDASKVNPKLSPYPLTVDMPGAYQKPEASVAPEAPPKTARPSGQPTNTVTRGGTEYKSYDNGKTWWTD